jgi:hypothetical protein
MTEENNINISLEQICASIIETVGAVDVPMETLLKDYSNKSIAVNQDPDTKVIKFTLVDNSQAENK